MLSRAQPLSDPMVPRASRIISFTEETRDVFTLELTPPEADTEFRFLPGQFNMLYAFGLGEAAISLSGDPESPGTLVHTIKAIGSVTQALWKLRRGDSVGIRGPFGRPWPVARARGKDLLLAAGGIGLAPLRPVLYQVAAQREQFGKVSLVYGTRTPEDIVFGSELSRFASRSGIEVIVTVDRAAPGWTGNVGVGAQFLDGAKVDASNAVAMICGPEIMIRFTGSKLRALGFAEGDIYVSLERNMKCGVGFCGHCQLGPIFVCKDGPVFPLPAMKPWMNIREI